MFKLNKKKTIHNEIEFINNLKEIQSELDENIQIHDKLLIHACGMVGNDNYYIEDNTFTSEFNKYFEVFGIVGDVIDSRIRLKSSLSTYPDKEIKTFITFYSGHFYDPHTGNNFNGRSDHTALTNFISYSERAYEAKQNNNEKRCRENLAKACHYLADLNQPHHASNHIAILKKAQIEVINKNFGILAEAKESNHSSYEKKVREWIDNPKRLFEDMGELAVQYQGMSLLVENMPIEERSVEDNMSSLRDRYYTDLNLPLKLYCEKIGIESAIHATEYRDDVLSDNIVNQAIATLHTIRMTQIQIARFLFYFFTKQ